MNFDANDSDLKCIISVENAKRLTLYAPLSAQGA